MTRVRASSQLIRERRCKILCHLEVTQFLLSYMRLVRSKSDPQYKHPGCQDVAVEVWQTELFSETKSKRRHQFSTLTCESFHREKIFAQFCPLEDAIIGQL